MDAKKLNLALALATLGIMMVLFATQHELPRIYCYAECHYVDCCGTDTQVVFKQAL
jgi:hypothetical protein